MATPVEDVWPPDEKIYWYLFSEVNLNLIDIVKSVLGLVYVLELDSPGRVTLSSPLKTAPFPYAPVE